MVIASHVIVTTYGFWLPNDPRGSWSEFVGAWELLRYGKATKVTTRRSVAAARHDHQRRLAAKTALKYPTVEFAGIDGPNDRLPGQDVGRCAGKWLEIGGQATKDDHDATARWNHGRMPGSAFRQWRDLRQPVLSNRIVGFHGSRWPIRIRSADDQDITVV